MELYDEIGVGYRNSRRPDPRIATAIFHALGEAETVVNVGAGAGSHEPSDRSVIAVEPSMTMIRQRPVGSAPAVQASATHLPFRSATFEAALAILTVHHWPDRARGLGELARVARDRIVILTWDPATSGFWLVDDYFPEIVDGFLGAYWRRPHAYLDASVRSAISTFSKIHALEAGLTRLRRDLQDGTWERRYGDLLGRREIDLGYRLLVSGGGRPQG